MKLRPVREFLRDHPEVPHQLRGVLERVSIANKIQHHTVDRIGPRFIVFRSDVRGRQAALKLLVDKNNRFASTRLHIESAFLTYAQALDSAHGRPRWRHQRRQVPVQQTHAAPARCIEPRRQPTAWTEVFVIVFLPQCWCVNSHQLLPTFKKYNGVIFQSFCSVRYNHTTPLKTSCLPYVTLSLIFCARSVNPHYCLASLPSIHHLLGGRITPYRRS